MDNSSSDSLDTVASSDTQKYKYYTDVHDVDENLKTICSCGGWMSCVDWTGIVHRNIQDSSSKTATTVASKIRTPPYQQGWCS